MRKAKTTVVMFNINDVFAAACAAQRINGEYLRSPEYSFDEKTVENKIVRQSNKDLVHKMLTDPDMAAFVTDSDRKDSETVRTYFQCKLMDVLSNTANEFTKLAVSLASRSEIASNDRYSLAVIASLPKSHISGIERDKKNESKADAMSLSQHFGTIGTRVTGECEVIDARFSHNWNIWYVTARFNNNVILFTYKSELATGAKHQFTGTVKSHRENNVTQLNRVKIK